MPTTDEPAPFPPGFFRRQDERDDAVFYAPERMVMHIDDGAVAAAGELYAELGVSGRVVDLCSSWVSHLGSRPAHLTVLGMNRREMEANPMADEIIVHDLNADPTIPLPDTSADAVVCTVSMDYLTRPIEVVGEIARVLRPGGVWCCTFSNRLFPSKAVLGWLYADEEQRPEIVRTYIERAGGFGPVTTASRLTTGRDPLWGVWARRDG